MDNDKDKTNGKTNDPKAGDALDEVAVVRPITDEELAAPVTGEKQTGESGQSSKEAEPRSDASTQGKPDNQNDKNGQEAEAQAEAASDQHLKEAIAEQAREDERPHSSNFTLGKILGGDILTAQMFRNNIWLIVLVVGFVVIYITNRYKVQKDLLEIDKLNTELEDAKYRALSSSSNLTEKSRESHVIESLQNSPDSDLRQSDRPPYIINVPDK